MLLQIKCNVVCEHLVDTTDELAGTMPESTVVTMTFRTLRFVVIREDLVVLHHIMSGVDECPAQRLRAALGHPGLPGLKLTGLFDRGVKTREGKKLVRPGETVNVADLAKNDTSFKSSDAGNGHDNGIQSKDDLPDLGFHSIDLAIQ